MALRRKPAGKPGEWYYCVRHRKVEEGPECRALDRLGPYPSRGEAAHALEHAAERNEEWDRADRDADPGAAGGDGPEGGGAERGGGPAR